jgi:hypothetical protein
MLNYYLYIMQFTLLLSGVMMFNLISFFSYRFINLLEENITVGLFRL